MKRFVVIGASAALSLTLSVGDDSPAKPVVWAAPPDAAKLPNPVASDPTSIAAGKELFVTACVPCHGTTGRGDGIAAPSLERDGKPIRPGNLTSPSLKAQSDGALFWKISTGNDPMPGVQESYNETQRWQLINYVRTLAAQPQAVAAVEATPAPKTGLTGAEAYALHCARCHPERYPAERTAAQWKTLMLHMRVRANLPAKQARLVLDYLQANSGN